MSLRALLICTLVVAAAAGGALALPAAAQQGLPVTTDPGIVDGSAQHALDHARARWARLKIRNYDYAVMRACFCPYTGWVTIKVRNGVPSRRSQAADAQLATVPRMFRQIQRLIDAKAHRLTVRYGARGLPVDVFSDPIQNAVDDEGGFGTCRFKRR
jgi:hypothetical protein